MQCEHRKNDLFKAKYQLMTAKLNKNEGRQMYGALCFRSVDPLYGQVIEN